MRIEEMPEALRIQLQAVLPPRAFLRRDRGCGLFITNAAQFDPGFQLPSGFLGEREGGTLRILPDESCPLSLEKENPCPPDQLGASLLRFRGQAPDRENLLLFVQGLKLLDAGKSASHAEILAYDRILRQRAAIALRGGCGGALYAAALIHAQIQFT